MSLFALTKDYYRELEKDPEFEKKATRLYYAVFKLKYKSENISVAVPLRANLNANYQKNRDEYLATPPTEHTQAGAVAGWHITKMIPVNSDVLIKVKTQSQDLDIAEYVVNQKKQDFIDKIKKMLSRIEQGEKVFGTIDFDAALRTLQQISEKRTAQQPTAQKKNDKVEVKAAQGNNRVKLTGILLNEPTRQPPSPGNPTSITSYDIVVPTGKRKDTFHITSYGQQADLDVKHLKRGNTVAVEGDFERLNNNGVPSFRLNAHKVTYLIAKPNAANTAPSVQLNQNKSDNQQQF